MSGQDNDPHAGLGMAFSALFRPPWAYERDGVEPTLENSLRGLVMTFVNAVAFRLQDHGLSPVKVPKPPFPDFSYVVAATNDAVLIVLGTSPFRMSRTAAYRDVRKAATVMSASELQIEMAREHGWRDCVAATLPLKALATSNSEAWPLIEQVAHQTADALATSWQGTSREVARAVAIPNNGRVFVSHAHEDNKRCIPLLSALDAWDVDYWFDTERLMAGQGLSERIQQAIEERDIFIRICTPAAQQSFWVNLETEAFRSLQAKAHRPGQDNPRLLINLILDTGYQLQLFDNAFLYLDATKKLRREWLAELRRALGIMVVRGGQLERGGGFQAHVPPQKAGPADLAKIYEGSRPQSILGDLRTKEF